MTSSHIIDGCDDHLANNNSFVVAYHGEMVASEVGMMDMWWHKNENDRVLSAPRSLVERINICTVLQSEDYYIVARGAIIQSKQLSLLPRTKDPSKFLKLGLVESGTFVKWPCERLHFRDTTVSSITTTYIYKSYNVNKWL